MTIKTKTIILSVGLELLNSQGEGNISSLDIANEMEISPGNLYYHYKGKTDIIDALATNFHDLLREFEANVTDSSAEKNWLSLYVLLEHIYRYRFLFRNPVDLSNKYPDSADTINKILYHLFRSLNTILKSLTDNSEAQRSDGIPTDIILIFFTNWIQYRDTINPGETEKEGILAAMIRMEIMLAPNVDEPIKRFMTLSNHSYNNS